jgi:hypothetical protein
LGGDAVAAVPSDAVPDAEEPASDPVDAEAPVSDDEVRDELPDDLDAAGYVGPYLFPNNNRRRVPGYLYLMVAAALLVTWLVTLGDAPVLVNGGFVVAAVLLAVIGAYSLAAGWNLDVDERDALAHASEVVGFAVGHASAQMGWRGWLSRPTWRILVYSGENPPKQRGLVLVDGVDGEVVSWFVEANPEDWSDLDGSLGADHR